MTKRTGPTNEKLRETIVLLDKASKKYKSEMFKSVAKELARPTRIRRKVNVYQINKHLRDGETAIVPGKVLSTGDLTKKVTVAAWDFSDKAREKINTQNIFARQRVDSFGVFIYISLRINYTPLWILSKEYSCQRSFH